MLTSQDQQQETVHRALQAKDAKIFLNILYYNQHDGCTEDGLRIIRNVSK